MSASMSQPVTTEDVHDLFRIILGREVPAGDKTVASFVAGAVPLEKAIRQFIGSEEFKKRFLKNTGIPLPSPDLRPFQEIRNPKHLHRSGFKPQKVLLVGSCLMEHWVDAVHQEFGVEAELFNVNNGITLPELSADEAKAVDFQIVQIPLRVVLPDHSYFSISYSNESDWQRLFEDCCARIDRLLFAALRHNREHGLMSFVLNFMRPQQNTTGKLTEKYRLSNLDYFIAELNRYLDGRVRELPNAFMVDFDQLCANMGYCWVGEDSVRQLNHGNLLSNTQIEAGTRRIVPEKNVDSYFTIRSNELILAAFDEILEMRRSVMQHDAVKIVIFDLDDTLWRGIAAEADAIDVAEMSEGWPRSLVEAASLLWRRGILVALCSKNDQETVERIWAKVYGKAFPIENFVVRKINWQKKADNIREILQMVNLLPESALFVDDNPAERSGVKEALPGIRVLEQPLVEWRRTLIWSAELQPATVTGESADRTRTIKAQIERKEDSQNLSAEDHLRQLDVRITPTVITDPSGRVFERCFELINKTNQFNTTGRRWTLAEMIGFLKEGGTLISVEVEDRHASYGITGVAMVTGTRVEQLVLSCRVFGMGVEQTMLALCLRQIAAQCGETEVTGPLLDTGKNRLAHDIFAQVGMVQVENGVWRGQLTGVTDAACTIPAHVTLAA